MVNDFIYLNKRIDNKITVKFVNSFCTQIWHTKVKFSDLEMDFWTNFAITIKQWITECNSISYDMNCLVQSITQLN